MNQKNMFWLMIYYFTCYGLFLSALLNHEEEIDNAITIHGFVEGLRIGLGRISKISDSWQYLFMLFVTHLEFELIKKFFEKYEKMYIRMGLCLLINFLNIIIKGILF